MFSVFCIQDGGQGKEIQVIAMLAAVAFPQGEKLAVLILQPEIGTLIDGRLICPGDDRADMVRHMCRECSPGFEILTQPPNADRSH